MLVLTVDQRRNRRTGDRTEELLQRLHGSTNAHRLYRRFERTAEDEVQGVPSRPDDAVDIVLELVRLGGWDVGVGVGSGPAGGADQAIGVRDGQPSRYARDAAERARTAVRHVAVAGPDQPAAREAEALLTLLAALVQRRSEQGWEVVDLVASGHSQREVARQLQITPQAVSQRLHAAWWREEELARPLAAKLLASAGA